MLERMMTNLALTMTTAFTLAIFSLAPTPMRAQGASTGPQIQSKEVPARDFWLDPSTGLMWAAKDNGKDVSWKGAIKYCRKSNLAGFNGWRMPNLDELQGLYDKRITTSGMAGDKQHYRSFTWHIKGNIFLTGDQWTTLRRVDDSGKPVSYVYYFDFNDGLANNDPIGWPYHDAQRVLCVRGPEANPNHRTTERGLIKLDDY